VEVVRQISVVPSDIIIARNILCALSTVEMKDLRRHRKPWSIRLTVEDTRI